MKALAGRVALVTGVSRRQGIGFAIAERLLADGARVFASGWSEHDAEMPWGGEAGGIDAVLEALGGTGEALHFEAFDLERAEASAALVDAVYARFGALDVLVANHARSSHQGFAEVTAEELDRCWAANARSPILLAQHWARRRPTGPGGRLLTFTSGQHIGPMPDELAYAVSKGALHQMTASLSDALIEQGITVNCINPGPVDSGWPSPRAREVIAKMFPGGEMGTPESVARLVAWLASDEAAWITGQVHDSEGGFRRWARAPLERGEG